jgi:hypothetical protein
MGFWDFGKKRVVLEVITCEVGFDGFEIRHAFGDDSGSVSGATELKVVLDNGFQSLLQLNQINI